MFKPPLFTGANRNRNMCAQFSETHILSTANPYKRPAAYGDTTQTAIKCKDFALDGSS